MDEISHKIFAEDGLYLYEPTHVVGCKFFQIVGLNPDHHGAELHGDGTLHNEPMYIFDDCVFDNMGVEADTYDEGVAMVNAPYAIFNRCRFTHWGKAALIGNGEPQYVETDKNLRVVFNECIFENNCRRSPFIQYGHAVLNNCLIKNWGDRQYFYLKAHGLRVGKAASCSVINTVFIQEHFWPGLKNLVTDVMNQYAPIIIPGNFRGAYAEPGGKLSMHHCYKNSPLVWFSAYNENPMGKEEAERKIEYLETVVPKL